MSKTGTIPRRIDYRRAAFDRADLAGVLTLSALPRTQAVCVERHETDVAVEMGFEEDAQRRVIVEGRASAHLKLPCQRCLEAADVALDTPIRGMAVADDTAAASVPRDWEPMLADGQTLDLHALVDDELLLEDGGLRERNDAKSPYFERSTRHKEVSMIVITCHRRTARYSISPYS